MRKMLAALALAYGLIAQSALAAPDKAEITEFLRQLHTLPNIRQDYEEMGFQGENLELALEQMRRILGDPAVGGYIADRLVALGQGELQSANLAAGLIDPLLDRGLGHLTARELSYFYQVEKVVMDALSRRDCGQAFKGRLAPQVLAERTTRVAARLNTPALREYYRIQLKAARLGVTRAPKKLSDAAMERAQARLMEALKAQARTRGDARLFERALQGFEGLSNGAACDTGRFFMDAIMSLPLRERYEVLIFMNGL